MSFDERARSRSVLSAGARPLPRCDQELASSGQPESQLLMTIDDVARIADALPSVRRASVDGLAQWRFHGRLVARQLDAKHVVIRADFDHRDVLLRQFPETFSVPAQFAKHMMVVAELVSGDIGAIEDAIEAAWELQRAACNR